MTHMGREIWVWADPLCRDREGFRAVIAGVRIRRTIAVNDPDEPFWRRIRWLAPREELSDTVTLRRVREPRVAVAAPGPRIAPMQPTIASEEIVVVAAPEVERRLAAVSGHSRDVDGIERLQPRRHLPAAFVLPAVVAEIDAAVVRHPQSAGDVLVELAVLVVTGFSVEGFSVISKSGVNAMACGSGCMNTTFLCTPDRCATEASMPSRRCHDELSDGFPADT